MLKPRFGMLLLLLCIALAVTPSAAVSRTSSSSGTWSFLNSAATSIDVKLTVDAGLCEAIFTSEVKPPVVFTDLKGPIFLKSSTPAPAPLLGFQATTPVPPGGSIEFTADTQAPVISGSTFAVIVYPTCNSGVGQEQLTVTQAPQTKATPNLDAAQNDVKKAITLEQKAEKSFFAFGKGVDDASFRSDLNAAASALKQGERTARAAGASGETSAAQADGIANEQEDAVDLDHELLNPTGSATKRDDPEFAAEYKKDPEAAVRGGFADALKAKKAALKLITKAKASR